MGMRPPCLDHLLLDHDPGLMCRVVILSVLCVAVDGQDVE